MKIKIEFNKTEKEILTDAINIKGIDLSKLEESKVSVGKFGSAIYNPEEGYIEINFKQDFIKFTSVLIKSFISLIFKGVEMIRNFTEEWFDDIKTSNSLETAITKEDNE